MSRAKRVTTRSIDNKAIRNLEYKDAIERLATRQKSLTARVYSMQTAIGSLAAQFNINETRRAVKNRILCNILEGVFSPDSKEQLTWHNHLLKMYPDEYRSMVKRTLGMVPKKKDLKPAEQEEEKDTEPAEDSPAMIRFRKYQEELQKAQKDTGTE